MVEGEDRVRIRRYCDAAHDPLHSLPDHNYPIDILISNAAKVVAVAFGRAGDDFVFPCEWQLWKIFSR